MSCNGNNHRPGCSCGWGGVFHGLGLGGRYWSRTDSYNNPNARCPRCSALVYFYKSPDGGSVYFDDLGPPWPKHPCMDAGNESPPTRRPRQNFATPLWAVNGWHPLQCESVECLKDSPDITILVSGQGSETRQLFAKTPNALIASDSPILWRRVNAQRGRYEISALDISNGQFKEIRFEAFDKLDEVEKQIRVERLDIQVKSFDADMAGVKNELLNSLSILGLEHKLNAEIAKFRQLLHDHGDPAEISRHASAALKRLLEREAQAKDRAQQADAIYEGLRAEAITLEKEFAHVGIDLKIPLRAARKKALAKSLALDEGKALLRKAAQRVVDMAVNLEQSRNARKELMVFIEEICTGSEQLTGKGKDFLENALTICLRTAGADILAIKEQLFQLACEYCAKATATVALQQERARQAEARDAELSSRIDGIIECHPGLDRSELMAALKRTTNGDATLKKVHAALDEFVRNWVATQAPAQSPVRPTGQRHGPRKSAPERNTSDAGGRGGRNRGTLGAPPSPFNSALGDNLRLALEQARKSG